MTAVIFSLFTVFGTVPSGVYADSMAQGASRTAAVDTEIVIPKKAGVIDKVYKGNATFPVIYIQDAHNSFEAQENISKIISHLVEQYGVKDVYVEGYQGQLPLDELFQIEDPKTKEKVSRFFMDQLRLTGAQYAYVNRTQDFKITGLEVFSDYMDNLEAYAQGAKNRERISEDLGKISKYLKALGDRVYPREIKRWLKLKKRFEIEELSLSDYLFRMMKIYSEIGDERLEISKKYPGLSLVAENLGEKHLSKKREVELNRKIKEMNAKEFFGELSRFEEDFADQFLPDEDAREVFEYQRILDLYRKLNDFSLSSLEYEELKKKAGEFSTDEVAHFLAKRLKKSLVLSNRWEALLADQEEFYKLALKRDQNFKMALQKSLTERELQAPIVVVTGGFHKDGVSEFFEEQDQSYLIVLPKISGSDPEHEKKYDFLMSGQYYSYEKPFFNVPTAAAQQPTLIVFPKEQVKKMVAVTAKSVNARTGEIDPKIIYVNFKTGQVQKVVNQMRESFAEASLGVEEMTPLSREQTLNKQSEITTVLNPSSNGFIVRAWQDRYEPISRQAETTVAQKLVWDRVKQGRARIFQVGDSYRIYYLNQSDISADGEASAAGRTLLSLDNQSVASLGAFEQALYLKFYEMFKNEQLANRFLENATSAISSAAEALDISRPIKKVLIAEDDPSIHAIYRDAFGHPYLGELEVIHVNNRVEALAYLEKYGDEVDLLISDRKMYGAEENLPNNTDHGKVLVEEVRDGLGLNTPVVFISGSDFTSDELEAFGNAAQVSKMFVSLAQTATVPETVVLMMQRLMEPYKSGAESQELGASLGEEKPTVESVASRLLSFVSAQDAWEYASGTQGILEALNLTNRDAFAEQSVRLFYGLNVTNFKKPDANKYFLISLKKKFLIFGKEESYSSLELDAEKENDARVKIAELLLRLQGAEREILQKRGAEVLLRFEDGLKKRWLKDAVTQKTDEGVSLGEELPTVRSVVNELADTLQKRISDRKRIYEASDAVGRVMGSKDLYNFIDYMNGIQYLLRKLEITNHRKWWQNEIGKRFYGIQIRRLVSGKKAAADFEIVSTKRKYLVTGEEVLVAGPLSSRAVEMPDGKVERAELYGDSLRITNLLFTLQGPKKEILREHGAQVLVGLFRELNERRREGSSLGDSDTSGLQKIKSALEFLKIKSDLSGTTITAIKPPDYTWKYRPVRHSQTLGDFVKTRIQLPLEKRKVVEDLDYFRDPTGDKARRDRYLEIARIKNIGDLKARLIRDYRFNFGDDVAAYVEKLLEDVQGRHLRLLTTDRLRRKGYLRTTNPLEPREGTTDAELSDRLGMLIWYDANLNKIAPFINTYLNYRMDAMRIWDLPIWPVDEKGNIRVELMESWIRHKEKSPPPAWFKSKLKSFAEIAGMANPPKEEKDEMKQGTLFGDDQSLGVEQLREDLKKKAQICVDRISEGDDFSESLPDVFLLMGNPDLRVFLEFAEQWKQIKEKLDRDEVVQRGVAREGVEKGIPIVVAGGRGRGTGPLIQAVQKKYNVDQISEFKSNDNVDEASILKFVLMREGIPEELIMKEFEPSQNTSKNFENSLMPVQLATLQRKINDPLVAIVTRPPLLLRAQATAKRIWPETWNVKRWKSYSFNLDEVVKNDDQLIELVGYLFGYPEDLAKSYPDLPTGNEIKGYYDQTALLRGVGAESIEWDSEDSRLLSDVKEAFQNYLSSLDLKYDPDIEHMKAKKLTNLGIQEIKWEEGIKNKIQYQHPGLDEATIEEFLSDPEFFEATVHAIKDSRFDSGNIKSAEIKWIGSGTSRNVYLITLEDKNEHTVQFVVKLLHTLAPIIRAGNRYGDHQEVEAELLKKMRRYEIVPRFLGRFNVGGSDLLAQEYIRGDTFYDLQKNKTTFYGEPISDEEIGQIRRKIVEQYVKFWAATGEKYSFSDPKGLNFVVFKNELGQWDTWIVDLGTVSFHETFNEAMLLMSLAAELQIFSGNIDVLHGVLDALGKNGGADFFENVKRQIQPDMGTYYTRNDEWPFTLLEQLKNSVGGKLDKLVSRVWEKVSNYLNVNELKGISSWETNRILVVDDGEAVSRAALRVLRQVIQQKNPHVLLPAGKTPKRLYQLIAREASPESLKNTRFYFVETAHQDAKKDSDEFIELLSQFNKKAKSVMVLDDSPESKQVLQELEENGGFDLAVLGISPKGRTAFHGLPAVPKTQKILLMALGDTKSEGVVDFLTKVDRGEAPGCMKYSHPFTVLVDKSAAGELEKIRGYERNFSDLSDLSNSLGTVPENINALLLQLGAKLDKFQDIKIGDVPSFDQIVQGLVQGDSEIQDAFTAALSELGYERDDMVLNRAMFDFKRRLEKDSTRDGFIRAFRTIFNMDLFDPVKVPVNQVGSWYDVIDALKFIENQESIAEQIGYIQELSLWIRENKTKFLLAHSDQKKFDVFPEDLAFLPKELALKILKKTPSEHVRSLKELILTFPISQSFDLHEDLWGSAEGLDDTLNTTFTGALRGNIHGAGFNQSALKLIREYLEVLKKDANVPPSGLPRHQIVLQDNDRELWRSLRAGGEWSSDLVQRLRELGKEQQYKDLIRQIKKFDGNLVEQVFALADYLIELRREGDETELKEILKTVEGSPGFREITLVTYLIQLERALTLVYEGAYREDIFDTWIKYPPIKEIPELVELLISVKENNLPPLQKIKNILKVRDMVRTLSQESDDIEMKYDLFYLHRTLGSYVDMSIDDVLKSLRQSPNPPKTYRDLLVLFLEDMITNHVVSRYAAQLTESLKDPTLTVGQMDDLLEKIHFEAKRTSNKWYSVYERAGQVIFGDDDEGMKRRERAVGRFIKERYIFRIVADVLIPQFFEKIEEIERRGGLGEYVSKASAESAIAKFKRGAYDQIVHTDDFSDVSQLKIPNELGRYGNKGINLVYQNALGLPTPSAFIIPSEVFKYGLHRNPAFYEELKEHLTKLEREWSQKSGKDQAVGSVESPMFIAVRPASAFVMPGIMESMTDLGFSPGIVDSKITKGEAGKNYLRAYLRFMISIGNVLGFSKDELERVAEPYYEKEGVLDIYQLSPDSLMACIDDFKRLFEDAGLLDQFNQYFNDPVLQISEAVNRVAEIWNDPHVKTYRYSQKLSEGWNTAVIVQAYVFGDVAPNSGSGVALSRDRKTQRKILTGEWMEGRQGEAIAQGYVSPVNVDHLREKGKVFKQLNEAARILDSYWGTADGYFGTPQIIEFTMEEGNLWLLQSGTDRSGEQKEFFHPIKFTSQVLEDAKGDVAYGDGGGLRGLVVFDDEEVLSSEVIRRLKEDSEVEAVILVVRYPTPDDSPRVINANRLLRSITGKRLVLLTQKGGLTSHASIVANANQIPAIVNVRGLEMDGDKVEFSGTEVNKYDTLTLDFEAGRVFVGSLPLDKSQSLGAEDAYAGLLQEFLKHEEFTSSVVRSLFSGISRHTNEKIVVGESRAMETFVAVMRKAYPSMSEMQAVGLMEKVKQIVFGTVETDPIPKTELQMKANKFVEDFERGLLLQKKDVSDEIEKFARIYFTFGIHSAKAVQRITDSLNIVIGGSEDAQAVLEFFALKGVDSEEIAIVTSLDERQRDTFAHLVAEKMAGLERIARERETMRLRKAETELQERIRKAAAIYQDLIQRNSFVEIVGEAKRRELRSEFEAALANERIEVRQAVLDAILSQKFSQPKMSALIEKINQFNLIPREVTVLRTLFLENLVSENQPSRDLLDVEATLNIPRNLSASKLENIRGVIQGVDPDYFREEADGAFLFRVAKEDPELFGRVFDVVLTSAQQKIDRWVARFISMVRLDERGTEFTPFEARQLLDRLKDYVAASYQSDSDKSSSQARIRMTYADLGERRLENNEVRDLQALRLEQLERITNLVGSQIISEATSRSLGGLTQTLLSMDDSVVFKPNGFSSAVKIPYWVFEETGQRGKEAAFRFRVPPHIFVFPEKSWEEIKKSGLTKPSGAWDEHILDAMRKKSEQERGIFTVRLPQNERIALFDSKTKKEYAVHVGEFSLDPADFNPLRENSPNINLMFGLPAEVKVLRGRSLGAVESAGALVASDSEGRLGYLPAIESVDLKQPYYQVYFDKNGDEFKTSDPVTVKNGLIQGVLEAWHEKGVVQYVLASERSLEEIETLEDYAVKELIEVAVTHLNEFSSHFDYLLTSTAGDEIKGKWSHFVESYLKFLGISDREVQIAVLSTAISEAMAVINQAMHDLFYEGKVPRAIEERFEHLRRLLESPKSQDPGVRSKILEERLPLILDQWAAYPGVDEIFLDHRLIGDQKFVVLREIFNTYLRVQDEKPQEESQVKNKDLVDPYALGYTSNLENVLQGLKISESSPWIASPEQSALMKGVLQGSAEYDPEKIRQLFRPSYLRIIERNSIRRGVSKVAGLPSSVEKFLEKNIYKEDSEILSLYQDFTEAFAESDELMIAKRLMNLVEWLTELYSDDSPIEDRADFHQAMVEGILSFTLNSSVVPTDQVAALRSFMVNFEIREKGKFLGDLKTEKQLQLPNESSPAFYNRLGVIAYLDRQWDTAIAYFKRAKELGVDRLLKEVDSHEGLLELDVNGVQDFSDLVSLNLGVSYLANGQWAEGVSYLRGLNIPIVESPADGLSLGQVMEGETVLDQIETIMDKLEKKPVTVVLNLSQYLALSVKNQEEVKKHLVEGRIKLLLTGVGDETLMPSDLAEILRQKSNLVRKMADFVAQSNLARLKGFIGEGNVIYFSKTLDSAQPIKEAIGSFGNQFLFVKQQGEDSGTLTTAMLLAADENAYQKFFKTDASGFWVLSVLYQKIAEIVQEFLGEQILAQAA